MDTSVAGIKALVGRLSHTIDTDVTIANKLFQIGGPQHRTCVLFIFRILPPLIL